MSWRDAYLDDDVLDAHADDLHDLAIELAAEHEDDDE